MQLDQIIKHLENAGYTVYPASLRELPDKGQIMVVRNYRGKAICHVSSADDEFLSDVKYHGFSGVHVRVCELSWKNYQLLKPFGLAPTVCDKAVSFGTGDRLGLITAAQLRAEAGYDVFPIIAQQSPRELQLTGRCFKDVLLDAVLGYLECGCTQPFGADADHIKDEKYLRMGIEAGYTMYTLDLSPWLQKPLATEAALGELSDTSKAILDEYNGCRIELPSGVYVVNYDALLDAALVYDKALENVQRYNSIIRESISQYDLEISVDEYPRDTTLEDALFVAAWLKRAGVDFYSLAPKFPGHFEKAVDYQGNIEELTYSLQCHAALARLLGYKLSLHSGSDKYGIYELYKEVTKGRFHIKTSGTSWLRAIQVVAARNVQLFGEMYATCLEALPETKKRYDVRIERSDFPDKLLADLLTFYLLPDVQQLFHISYGELLELYRDRLYAILHQHEAEHYNAVAANIARHMESLFPKA